MIIIDQLPVEMLLKIFSYLPSYGNVSLVNKLFYDVACKLNDSNVCVSFHSIFLVSKTSRLHSILCPLNSDKFDRNIDMMKIQ